MLSDSHKVYVLVECQLDLNCDAYAHVVEGWARGEVAAALLCHADGIDDTKPCFDIGNGNMTVLSTKVVDLKEIGSG